MFFFKKKKVPLTDIFTNNFVDIHSHLLPGIDDGAKDIDESIDLITKMRSYGIKNFITTPHIMGELYPNSSETILEKLELVKGELKSRNLNDISISAAAEYMMDEQFMLRIENDDILTLKDNFILVEMSFANPPLNLFEIIFEIQLKGYKPILAHPERYTFYHNNMNKYYKLKKAGCLFQLNLLSLTLNYGKGVQRASFDLLKNNLYDFVGSDTHHLNHLNLFNEINTKKNYDLITHLIEKNSNFL
jgi:tyrosine-protein phosphatase YwqE